MTFLILALVFGSLTILTIIRREVHDIEGASVATMVCAVLCGAFLVMAAMKSIPTALDVYRGKTTLEITYRDSVAVDSVVVYKVK